MLSPSLVILNEVKDLNSTLRVNSAKDLAFTLRAGSVKDLNSMLRINSAKDLAFVLRAGSMKGLFSEHQKLPSAQHDTIGLQTKNPQGH
jgi:hypothetical protein